MLVFVMKKKEKEKILKKADEVYLELFGEDPL